ncbi:MAG TPA: glycoside hydrolase family 3 N-terminal domain-containing protein [Gemmatimonadaceae bacterium]|nr:glycoside hydrolase family 3 N-terminal domain-containing protein [Gemmatimonadaceae bacterium]
MTTKIQFFIRSGIALLGLTACVPSVPTLPLPPGVDPSARQLLGAAKPGAETPLTSADRRWVDRTLASLTPKEKVGQLIMPWVGGDYAAVGSPEFEQVRKWVQEDGVGGLVMSIGLPLSYAAKLNELQTRAKVPVLIASDMENGPGMRLGNIYALPSLLPQGGGTTFPPVMALGATGSEDLAFKLGQVLGSEARAIGVHMSFGPVLDVNSNPLNPIINTRSFGENPEMVGRLARAYIRGARSMGLMTTGKHFPGHGDTDTDSHLDLPTIRGDRAHMDSVDLPPFRAAVAEGIDAIMTAHIAVVGVEGSAAGPATLSHGFMTGILRDEMHFGGVLFTDAMTMGGVAKRYGATEPLIMAMEAGADVLLMPRDVPTAIQTVLGAVKSGRLTQARIDASVRRILEAKARAGLREGRLVDLNAVDRIVAIPSHTGVADEIARRSITLAQDKLNLVPLAVDSTKRILSITYADQSDLIAGRAFTPIVEDRLPLTQSVRVDARTTDAEYVTLAAQADTAEVVLVSAYVSPREFAGTVGTQRGFSQFVEKLALSGKRIIVLSFGSPYLLSAFPSVSSYLLAWGGSPISQRAAALALLGEREIDGRLPISLPPTLPIGSGIHRAQTRMLNR